MVEKYQGTHFRIFIADGDADFCSALAASLSSESDIEVVGYSCNGSVAAEKVISLCPDVLITDIILPGLDGLGLIREINEKMAQKKPSVIVLSGYSSPVVMREITALGTDYFALKPLPRSILIDRIRSLKSQPPHQSKALSHLEICCPKSPPCCMISGPCPYKRLPVFKRSHNHVRERHRGYNAVTKVLYPTVAKIPNNAFKGWNVLSGTQSRSRGTGDVDEIQNIFGTPFQT